MILNYLTKSKVGRQVIIGLIVISLALYVVVSFGQAPLSAKGGAAVKIGDAKIGYHELVINKRQISGYARGMEPEAIDRYTAGNAMRNALLLNLAEHAGFKASNAELRDFVIRNRTQADGTFVNDEIWASNIQREYGMQVETFEAYLRDTILTAEKGRSIFAGTAFVSEEQIKKRFESNNRKVRLELMMLSSNDVVNQAAPKDDNAIQALMAANPELFMTGERRQIQFVAVKVQDFRDKAKPTEAELKARYEVNKDRYKQGEQVQARHILIKFDKHPEAEAKALIEKIKAEVDAGLDFAEAAKKYSEDGSKDSGGDLGSFGRGQMVPEFEQTAFAMPVNTVSQPVRTQFGFHIIKKSGYTPESTRPYEMVSKFLEDELINEKSRALAQAEISAFRTAVTKPEDFEKVAGEKKLKVETSSFFDKDNASDLGPILGRNFQVRNAAFELKKLQDLSDVVDGGQLVAVIKWTAEAGPQSLDFSQDRGRVQFKANQVAGRNFVIGVMKEIMAKAANDPSKSLRDLAGTREFLKDNHFQTTEMVGEQQLPFDVRNLKLNFETEIYGLEDGAFLPLKEESENGRWVLARLKEKTVPDMGSFEKERAALVSQVREEEAGDLLGQYLWGKMKKLDPEKKLEGNLMELLKEIR